MRGTRLPTSVVPVADALQEAAAYESLQLKRRQGVFGVLIGGGLLGMGLLGVFTPRDYGTNFLFGLGFLVVLFAVLIWARQQPAWQRVFEHPDMPMARLRRNPVYWLTSVVMVTAINVVEWAQEGGAGPTALRAVAAGLVLVMAASMAFTAWATRDRALVGTSAAGGLLALPVALGIVSADQAVLAWFAVFGGSFLLVGLVRLLAPRRWLVR